MPTALFLLHKARKDPLAWSLFGLSILVGPLAAVYRAEAPLLDPASTASQLTIQLLATAGAAWVLHALAQAELLLRFKGEAQRWRTEVFATAAGAAAVAGLAAASLQGFVGGAVPGLIWIPIKLGLLSAALSQGLRPARAAWALPILVWGAPQLRIEHLTAALSFPQTPQVGLELTYLASLNLLAWSLSYRACRPVSS